MNFENAAFAVVGAGLIVFALGNEARWWRRRHWRTVQGQVVGQEQDGRVYTPEVEYVLDGEHHTFTSKYGRSIPYSTGDLFTVLVSPDGNEAEICSLYSRTLATFVPLIAGMLMLRHGLRVIWGI